MYSSLPPLAAKEQMLVELSQWIARVLQYSAAHPSCSALADKTHRTLVHALKLESPLEIGVLKDDLVLGDETSHHPAIRTRVAPYLHERGVLLLRFVHGTTLPELTAFVDLLARSAQAIYDGGGLLRLSVERGISRIQVEEIGHDITAEEREEQKKRKALRSFFGDMLREMLARRAVGVPIGDQLGELLAHPDLAVSILEEDSRGGLAEAVAGMALMVQEEEARSGVSHAQKLKAVLLALSPGARVRVVVGFPPLVGEFRQALLWAFDELSEEELARFTFPSVRDHAGELDGVLYALSVLVPHDGQRFSMLRRLSLSLYDLPVDDPATVEVLTALARRPEFYDSFRKERECLSGSADRARAACQFVSASRPTRPLQASYPPQPLTSPSSPPSPSPDPRQQAVSGRDARTAVLEVVKVAARMKDFDAFAAKIPSAVARLAEQGSIDAVIGILRGFSEVSTPHWQAVAATTLQQAASTAATTYVLEELDKVSANVEGRDLEELVSVAKLLATHCPEAVFDRLEHSESRKMRRVLLDALPSAGTSLLPILRSKIRAPSWFVTRNVVMLLPRVGGVAGDLTPIARHPTERVRIEVVRALRAMPQDSAAMDILVGYLTDSSNEVKQAARVAVRGELLGAEAIAALADFAADEQQPEDLRVFSIRTLGLSEDDAAAVALFSVLQPRSLIERASSATVRYFAAAALRSSPAPSASFHFAEGLGSTVWRVRKACEKAAGRA